jgi:hypothetical protein
VRRKKFYKVFTSPVKLDADAIARMSLQDVLQLHLGVLVDMNAALEKNIHP